MLNRLEKLVNTKAENVINAPKVNYSFLPDNGRLPLLISPVTGSLLLPEWIKDNKTIFFDKLREYGGILFRGFKIDSVEKFQDFVAAFEASPLEYRQRTSPRFEVAKNIYHSTTYPSDQEINMHSENSYALNWSRYIVFCCIEPAEERGETPIADNRSVLNYLSSETREKFLQKGVRYVRNISKELGLSWEEVFQTTDKNEVASECRRFGMGLEWKDDDRLTLIWNNGAIYAHPETGEKTWFNHAFFFNKYALSEELLAEFESDTELPFSTYYGDGTIISREEIAEIRSAYARAAVTFPWEKGDVLFLDNMMVSHGRKPYKGKREIIVSMF